MCDEKCPVFGRGSYSFIDSIGISRSSFSFEPVIVLPGLIAFHPYKKDEVFVNYRGKLSNQYQRRAVYVLEIAGPPSRIVV